MDTVINQRPIPHHLGTFSYGNDESDVTRQFKEDNVNHIIIKIEKGVVADVYFTEPIKVTVVDHDVIEGEETFEARMKKAVMTMAPEQRVNPAEIEQTVKSLVLECIRPADRRLPAQIVTPVEAAA